MQYIITFFWSFLLVTMLNYVVSSVMGADFNFVAGAVISVVFSILVIIIAAVLPNEPVADAEHH
jgi:predicted PurR-regulated permease PerM